MIFQCAGDDEGEQEKREIYISKKAHLWEGPKYKEVYQKCGDV